MRVQWLWLIKVRRLVRLSLRDTWEQTIAPITDGAARLQVIVLFVAAFVVLPKRGTGRQVDAIISAVNTAEALVWAVFLFACLNLIGAPFRVSKAQSQVGTWQGRRFVYHLPLHLFTVVVDDRDNGRAHLFKVLDAEANSLVAVRIVLDRPDERVKAIIFFPNNRTASPFGWEAISKATTTDLRLPPSNLLELRTHSLASTTLTTVRVQLHWWEVG